MRRVHLLAGCLLAVTLFPQLAHAVSSAELYTAASYSYGRVETRLRFAAGDGVVSSFFSWKDGSEQSGTFWNELDFEKLGAACRLETNPIYGKPSANHTQRHALSLDLCGAFHTYAYEWTPDAIVWRVDDQEIRRETGATAKAFADNAAQAGMQIRFNVWPGDASFGGTFDPAILPVHEYVDWVQFSAWEDGQFNLAWREDFDGPALSENWLTATWASPKKHSTHASENVNLMDGYAVLSLTADDALGPAGAMPGDSGAAGSGASANGGAANGGSASGVGDAGTGSRPAGATSGVVPSPAVGTSGGCSYGGDRPNGGSCLLSGLGLAFACLARRRWRIRAAESQVAARSDEKIPVSPRPSSNFTRP